MEWKQSWEWTGSVSLFDPFLLIQWEWEFWIEIETEWKEMVWKSWSCSGFQFMRVERFPNVWLSTQIQLPIKANGNYCLQGWTIYISEFTRNSFNLPHYIWSTGKHRARFCLVSNVYNLPSHISLSSIASFTALFVMYFWPQFLRILLLSSDK